MKIGSIRNLLFVFSFLPLPLLSQQLDSSSLNPFLGSYKAAKWIDLPITESFDANAYINRKMEIRQDYFVLFEDTFPNVNYELREKKQLDFFRVYRNFDWRRLHIKEDKLVVLRVLSPGRKFMLPVDIIISSDVLILEYRGYFYYFLKD